tara:strand:- start:319 stop:912 length:594 start_codon:yes stop_codon:yes gene_type:complete
MLRKLLNGFNRIESVLCRFLLATFVCLLFVQILSRELFDHSFSWIEELSTYLFVWFVFLGASYAARMAAHNRVTFQFRFLPQRAVDWIEAVADLFWIAFNVYFIYLAIDFIFYRMNKFWKAQTLGIPLPDGTSLPIQMKWIYLILPIAFTLMTIRILQVNYVKLVRHEQIADPDQVDLEKIKHDLHLEDQVDDNKAG